MVLRSGSTERDVISEYLGDETSNAIPGAASCIVLIKLNILSNRFFKIEYFPVKRNLTSDWFGATDLFQ